MQTPGVQSSPPQNSSSGNTDTAHTTPRSAIPPAQRTPRQYVEFARRAVANINLQNPNAIIDPEIAALDRMAEDMLERAKARRYA